MNEVEGYVREVLRHIDAPPRERQRIVADLRSHLAEAIDAGMPVSEAVAQMGSAADVAAEFMAQIGQAWIRPWRRLAALSALLTSIYTLMAVFLLLGRLGLQSLPAGEPKEAWLFYALVYACGAISALAILFWRRWGVYGIAMTWVATLVLNALFPTPPQPGVIIVAGTVAVLFATSARRLWGYLT